MSFLTTLNSQILEGVILDIQSKLPVIGLDVMVVGQDKTTTDSNGEYKLDLGNCKTCENTGRVKIRMFNAFYGYHEEEITINKYTSNVSNIKISKEPSEIKFTGIIKNKSTNDPIKGIRVKITGDAYSSNLYSTDVFGEFQIVWDKLKLGAKKSIQVSIMDPSGRFKSRNNIAIPVGFPMEIELDYKMNVKGFGPPPPVLSPSPDLDEIIEFQMDKTSYREKSLHKKIELKDGNIWTNSNMDLNLDSYSVSNWDENIQYYTESYGRLYSWEAAKLVCKNLGEGWELPLDRDWQNMAKYYGGCEGCLMDEDPFVSYEHLIVEGISNFNATWGGFGHKGKNTSSKSGANGWYWSASTDSNNQVPIFIFDGEVGKLERTPHNPDDLMLSVRCIKKR